MTLIIMAAGMGSRYGGIKQIDPMGPNGEIILDYSVHDAVKAGFSKVIFIIRKDIEEAFRKSIGNRFKNKITIEYAFQELDNLPEGFSVPSGRSKPWGTAHAVLSCKNIISEPFIVINADDFYGAEAFIEGARGLKDLNNNNLEAFIVGYQLKKTLSPHGEVTRGVCEAKNGYLKNITERMKIDRNEAGEVQYHQEGKTLPLKGDEIVSMNFWGFTTAFIDALQERFTLFLRDFGRELKSEMLIPTEVDSLISSGLLKVKVRESGATWFGVTYPDDKPAVKISLADLVTRGEYDSPLWG